MANADMTQYLGVFLDEAREQLEVLESNVLMMERGDASSEMLQVLFRAAHTIKGSSRAMGFMTIGDLTHHMEDVLDGLRNGRQTVTTDTVDVLLNCLDTLTTLINEVSTAGATTNANDADVAALVARLTALCGDSPAAEPPVPAWSAEASDMAITDYERTAVDAAIDSGLQVHHVSVTLSSECVMKSVRAYMILSACGEVGTVLVSVPNEDALDAENFDSTIELLVASSCPPADLEAVLKTISELDRTCVVPWRETTAPPQPKPAVVETVDAAETRPRPETVAEARPRPETASPPAHNQTIRVDVARLDNLLNLIGEMVIDRTQISRLAADARAKYRQDDSIDQLVEATDRLGRITGELQEQVMKARMLPIDGVFQRMPRMVRDLAQKTGKEVMLTIDGGETELDRSVLEALGDPLIHLLRNSVDHGIENPEDRVAAGKPTAGAVRLSASHEENHIVIQITDDGRGIDVAAVKNAAISKGSITKADADAMSEHDGLMLIFGSGISTARKLSDISGRGVGMDIVRSNLERLGGRVDVETKLGAGTTFTIRLPLTLAIVRGLSVRAGKCTYVFPLSSVVEILRLGAYRDGVRIRSAGGQATILLRHRTVPVISLAGTLAGDPKAATPAAIPADGYLVVVGMGARRIGVAVDSLCGEQEVVIKSLGSYLGDVHAIAGATILGNGSVGLIVDVTKLV